MGFPATELLKADFLTELGFDKGRTGDAHKAGSFTLDEEILHYRVIGLTAKARTHE